MSVMYRSSFKALVLDSKIASSETNDCFVYALATAFEISYDEAHEIVKERFNRKDRTGTSGLRIKLAFKDMLEGRPGINGKTITEAIERPKTKYKLYGEVVERSLRVESFAKKYSSGTYLLLMSNHAITIKDGVVVDNKDRPSLKSLVIAAYKVENV